MSFIDWLDKKNERLVRESFWNGCKIEMGGLIKDKEVTKTFFINERIDGGYTLRNTKKVTSNTKYWVFNEINKKVVTQKTSRVVLEDVFRTTIDPQDVMEKRNSLLKLDKKKM